MFVMDYDELERKLPKIHRTAELMNNNLVNSPGSSIPKESLNELRDLNDQLRSIDDRLDRIEAESRAESALQKKRFYLNIFVGSVSAATALIAAVAAVWTVFHPPVP